MAERIEFEPALTTYQAAHYLGMSRMFLVGLLKRGDIPFHMVGTHRRIYEKDVIAYKAQRDSERKKALAELVKAEHEEGIYDRH